MERYIRAAISMERLLMAERMTPVTSAVMRRSRRPVPWLLDVCAMVIDQNGDVLCARCDGRLFCVYEGLRLP